MTQAMPRVLIAEDDEAFGDALAAMLRSGPMPCAVTVTANGAAALEAIEERAFDVLITDIHMPIMDGIELLTTLISHNSSLAFIVMTASPQMKKTVASIDERLIVLEKPVRIDDIRAMVRAAFEGATRGELSGVSLPSFVQLLMQERKTISVHVAHGNHRGVLHFMAGKIVDADLYNLDATQAAMHMLSWTEARIDMARGVQLREPRIHQRSDFLLLEALRRKDEGTLGTLIEPSALPVANAEDVEIDAAFQKFLSADDNAAETTPLADVDPVAQPAFAVPHSASSPINEATMKTESVVAAAKRNSASAVVVLQKSGTAVANDGFLKPSIERGQYFERLAGLLGKELGLLRLTDLMIVGREKALLIRSGNDGTAMVEVSPDADLPQLLADLSSELP